MEIKFRAPDAIDATCAPNSLVDFHNSSRPGCTTGNAPPKTEGPTNQKLSDRSRTSTHVAPSRASADGPGSSWRPSEELRA